MDDEKKDIMPSDHSDYKPVNRFDASAVHHLSGMYQNWFLDYASYVILERAVPHIEDGLKPVQRRILHSMKRMDDGRFNKVALHHVSAICIGPLQPNANNYGFVRVRYQVKHA